jgi:hypothetical protein
MDEAYFLYGPLDEEVHDVDRLDDHIYVECSGMVAHYSLAPGYKRTYEFVEWLGV